VGKYSFIISILFSTSTTLIAQTITSKNPDNAQQSQSLPVSIAGQNTHFQQGSPTLTSINPDSAHQGQNLSVTITGQNTHFQQGSQTLTSVVPHNAQQGRSLPVTITGQNNHFTQGSGTTGVWFSQGSPTVNIYSNSYSASSDASVNASFDIPSDAPLGVWNVNVNISIDGWLGLCDGFTIIKRPVLLVHGSTATSSIWNTMINYLVENDYIIEKSLFTIDLHYPWIIEDYGRQVFNKLEEITNSPGVSEVDIVAHSMGGLASRYCIEELGGDKYVGKLIMLGTPNHGSLGLSPKWQSSVWWVPSNQDNQWDILQMHPKSDFLAELNYNEPNFNSNSWLIKDDQIDQIPSRYTVLAGSGFETGEMFWNTYQGNEGFIPRSTYNGDGVVGIRSAKLTNVPCYQYNVAHGALNVASNPILDVIHLLNNEPVEHGVLCQPSPRNSSEPSLWQRIRIKANELILQGTIKTFEIILDTMPIAEIGIGYPGSELDLTLITPSGVVIDAAYASSDPNIDFTYDVNSTDNLGNNYDEKYYTISNPESGSWTIKVTDVNVPPEGEKFSVGAMLNSNLTLLARTRDNIYSFPPGEPIILEAFLWDGELLNYPGTEAEGTVEKPDGTKEIIAFRDDGINGDSIAGDGVFTYNYTDTMANGMYYADINADSGSFARQTQLIFSINMLLDGANFADYAVFADRWMDQSCTHASWCNGADLNKSGEVDIFDLGNLAEHWLEGTLP
ncbi:MAG: esterase/lipase family protein, partial [Planctomycetota bacterium]